MLVITHETVKLRSPLHVILFVLNIKTFVPLLVFDTLSTNLFVDLTAEYKDLS